MMVIFENSGVPTFVTSETEKIYGRLRNTGLLSFTSIIGISFLKDTVFASAPPIGSSEKIEKIIPE